MKKYNIKLIFAYSVTALWAAGTGYAFYIFFFANISYFADIAKLDYYRNSLEKLYMDPDVKNFIKNQHAKAVVINYLDDNCACTKFSKIHVKQIENRFASKGIIYINISKNKEQKINGNVNILSLKNLPASPAVAVFDSEGDLSYFGPYSDDYFCGTGSENFAEKSIHKILLGEKFNDMNLLASGCFCKTEA